MTEQSFFGQPAAHAGYLSLAIEQERMPASGGSTG